jgi:hypothetical protein
VRHSKYREPNTLLKDTPRNIHERPLMLTLTAGHIQTDRQGNPDLASMTADGVVMARAERGGALATGTVRYSLGLCVCVSLPSGS